MTPGGKKVPVLYVVDAQARFKLAHAIGRVHPPVETNRDDIEGVLAKGLLCDFDLVAQIARDRRADVVAARVNHADDERFAAQLCNRERLSFRITQRVVVQLTTDRALADVERR
jgi:hypothetical protein